MRLLECILIAIVAAHIGACIGRENMIKADAIAIKKVMEVVKPAFSFVKDQGEVEDENLPEHE